MGNAQQEHIQVILITLHILCTLLWNLRIPKNILVNGPNQPASCMDPTTSLLFQQ